MVERTNVEYTFASRKELTDLIRHLEEIGFKISQKGTNFYIKKGAKAVAYASKKKLKPRFVLHIHQPGMLEGYVEEYFANLSIQE